MSIGQLRFAVGEWRLVEPGGSNPSSKRNRVRGREDDLVAVMPHRGLQGGSYDGPDLSARESS